MNGAKVRPGMHVIGHELDGVAVNVVVQAAGDGVDVVASDLGWLKLLPAYGCLQFFRNDEVAPLHVPAMRTEVVKPRRHTRHRAAINVFGEIFTDNIEWPQVEPGV